MEEANLVLFDQSSYYVEHLYEYLLHEKKIALNIECFTEKDLFLNFSQSTRIQILIINEYLLDFFMEKAINNIQNIVIFQETYGFYQSKIYDFFSQESVLFLKKYKSSNTFLKE